ncbi:NAD(P)/FAD-dependent oxidoreductase [Sulfuriroseicoccus oceanibius]|uniref:FAD-binding oxidoreductase n=1 Tax=Sulfuriroseicoccus oceanibius TaxID=2707525 RepID=A0A6B3L429_9BACT|nr:FAD-dependent oxidoreductase [Sulfuriroseicoccus oceanibius]QQL44833.1 FAD-binding oxidoreductase [Sulfuriroseicoccus oceanibius]
MSDDCSELMNEGAPRVLVVGLGVAGSTLAWQLMWRGADVWVVDPAAERTTSRAAAGLITPITGKGMALSWRFGELWSEGEAFYQRLREATGRQVFHGCPTVRVFVSEAEARKFQRRMEGGGEYLDFVDSVFSAGEVPAAMQGAAVAAPFGGFVMKGGGWVDTAALLDVTRAELDARGRFVCGVLDERELEVREDGVVWNARRYDAVVFCQGAEGRNNALFAGHVAFRPAKGEFLTLGLKETTLENLGSVVNRQGTWICPRGDGSARSGSTYDFECFDHEPTSGGRAAIVSKLEQFLESVPQVIGASAGVRPVIRQSQPVAGFHPGYGRRVGFFNGLGSKGCSVGPWAAGLMAESVVRGGALPDELDLAGVWSDEAQPS